MGTFPRYSSSLPAMGRAGRDYLPSSKGDESMPHAITTSTKTKKRDHLALFSTGLIILALLVAACGGSLTRKPNKRGLNRALPGPPPHTAARNSTDGSSTVSLTGPSPPNKKKTTTSAA